MGVMCSTSQCELRSTFPNVRVTNVIRIVTFYTLPPLESPTSSWMTRSQRSRRRDKGLWIYAVKVKQFEEKYWSWMWMLVLGSKHMLTCCVNRFINCKSAGIIRECGLLKLSSHQIEVISSLHSLLKSVTSRRHKQPQHITVKEAVLSRSTLHHLPSQMWVSAAQLNTYNSNEYIYIKIYKQGSA